MNPEFKDIRVVILAGGLGTRLRPVISDRPKVLAPLGDKVLLDYIIGNLLQWGFRDILLCVGHMKEKVREHIQEQSFPKDAIIKFSEEENPLGTGGAIKKALGDFLGETALVLNGDTLFFIDYNRLVEQHVKHNAYISICLRQINDASRFGTVLIDRGS